MTRRQHEIPTHLDVEDKVFLGLTVRQFLYLLVGCSLAYGLWSQPDPLPDVLRVGGGAVCLAAAVALALLRPLGRPLEEWLVAGAFYLATPRRATWRPVEPDPADWRPPREGWQDLAPSLAWTPPDGSEGR